MPGMQTRNHNRRVPKITPAKLIFTSCTPYTPTPYTPTPCLPTPLNPHTKHSPTPHTATHSTPNHTTPHPTHPTYHTMHLLVTALCFVSFSIICFVVIKGQLPDTQNVRNRVDFLVDVCL